MTFAIIPPWAVKLGDDKRRYESPLIRDMIHTSRIKRLAHRHNRQPKLCIISVGMGLNRRKRKTAFRAVLSARLAADTVPVIGNRHVCLYGFIGIHLFERQYVLGAGLEATAAADTEVFLQSLDELRCPLPAVFGNPFEK
jgi:hypothetical protein